MDRSIKSESTGDLPEGEESADLLEVQEARRVALSSHRHGSFALEDDEMAKAYRDGKLNRNFMGYTVLPGQDFWG